MFTLNDSWVWPSKTIRFTETINLLKRQDDDYDEDDDDDDDHFTLVPAKEKRLQSPI